MLRMLSYAMQCHAMMRNAEQCLGILINAEKWMAKYLTNGVKRQVTHQKRLLELPKTEALQLKISHSLGLRIEDKVQGLKLEVKANAKAKSYMKDS